MDRTPTTLLEAVTYFADPDRAHEYAVRLRRPSKRSFGVSSSLDIKLTRGCEESHSGLLLHFSHAGDKMPKPQRSIYFDGQFLVDQIWNNPTVVLLQVQG